MQKYNIFGAQITTVQQNRLAVVGLCLEEKTNECENTLDLLKALRFDSDNPTQIDMILADKLSSLYRKRAVIVGASAYIENVYNKVYRTGGVIGNPEKKANDADNDLERIDDSLWMYTISGGPGWVGFFSQTNAKRLSEYTINHSVSYAERVNGIYRELKRLSPAGFIFVSDGTGYDSFGLCAAKLGNIEMSYFV